MLPNGEWRSLNVLPNANKKSTINVCLWRFVLTEGCAPAPGSYEIKPGELKGAASFDKSDRFRPAKTGG